MGERLNFICLGDRALAPHEHRPCVEAIASRLEDLNARLVEVMRIDGRTGAETLLPWDSSARLVDAPIDSGALLVAYFTIDGNNAAGRQSVTLDTRQGSSVVTLSLLPRLLGEEGIPIAAMLAALVGWAMETFEAAALACGPELDLYEAGDEADLRCIEERLSADWRCWFCMSARSFPKRFASQL